jgi:hypothetical protein
VEGSEMLDWILDLLFGRCPEEYPSESRDIRWEDFGDK